MYGNIMAQVLIGYINHEIFPVCEKYRTILLGTTVNFMTIKN